MPYTTQRAVARVYTILGYPTQEELYHEDVRDELNEVAAGYVQDQDLAGRDRRTVTEEVQVVEDDIDFLLTVPNAPDFEPQKLWFREVASVSVQGWLPATLVPFAAFDQQSTGGRVVGSIYGSYALPEGQKLKLNLTPEEVARLSWRLAFRLPLLAELQMGDRPPVPENFMPMLALETAIKCVKLVKSRRQAWKEWKEENLPLVIAELRDWKNPEGTGRWQKYLESSVEDPVQPLARFDRPPRRGAAASPRAYLPRE